MEEAQQRAATLQILAGTAPQPARASTCRSPTRSTKSAPTSCSRRWRNCATRELKRSRSPAASRGHRCDSRSRRRRDTGGSAAARVRTTAAPGASGHVVRLVASSFFVDAPDRSGIVVDGVSLAPPYDIVAIGDPHTMSTAMGIPGGVLDTLTAQGRTGHGDHARRCPGHCVAPGHGASVRSPGTSGLSGRLTGVPIALAVATWRPS